MIESGKIDVYYGEYNSYTVPKEITNYETILSLESVLNNVSKELSKLPGVNFEVNQIKMEYRMFNDKEDKSKMIEQSTLFHPGELIYLIRLIMMHMLLW